LLEVIVVALGVSVNVGFVITAKTGAEALPE
jgi:hypothetical protein